MKKLRDEIDSAIKTLKIIGDEDLMEGIMEAKKDFEEENILTYEQYRL